MPAPDAPPAALPAPVQAYLAELVRRIESVLADSLVGVYLFGSGALGDYLQGPSDLDVAVVTGGPVSCDLLRRLSERIAHPGLPCPARGLELVVYSEQALGDPSGPPAYLLDLNTGPEMEPRMSKDPAGEAGHWYTLDVAIGRSHGVALWGPPPNTVFAARPDSVIRTALEESLAWHEAHEPDGANTAPNAGRAWRWAVDGVWDSKASAAAWATERLDDPAAPAAEVIRRAREALRRRDS